MKNKHFDLYSNAPPIQRYPLCHNYIEDTNVYSHNPTPQYPRIHCHTQTLIAYDQAIDEVQPV